MITGLPRQWEPITTFPRYNLFDESNPEIGKEEFQKKSREYLQRFRNLILEEE